MRNLFESLRKIDAEGIEIIETAKQTREIRLNQTKKEGEEEIEVVKEKINDELEEMRIKYGRLMVNLEKQVRTDLKREMERLNALMAQNWERAYNTGLEYLNKMSKDGVVK